jgi:hypothetical protein
MASIYLEMTLGVEAIHSVMVLAADAHQARDEYSLGDVARLDIGARGTQSDFLHWPRGQSVDR